MVTHPHTLSDPCVGWSHCPTHHPAVGHRDSELAFCKPVLTWLIITVLIRELSQALHDSFGQLWGMLSG